MMLSTVVTCLVIATAATAAPTGDIQCAVNSYPPPSNATVPTFVINLDLPPEQRWNALIAAKKQEINALRAALVNLVNGVFGGKILSLIDNYAPKLLATLPSPYKEELQAMSNITGMPIGEVILYNVFYEFFTVCTSIVGEDANGQIIHARNLDFGLFLGWDTQNHTWAMTEVLRPTVVQLDWQKGGKTLFKSVNFAGYIGLLTAVKPGVMSITIDERFQLNGGFIGLIQWIVGLRDQSWVGFLTRDIMERGESFEQAQQTLIKAKLIAPVYFILGGTKSGEGVILTKDRNSDTADVYTMKDNAKYGDWYVLETNYDHWAEVPFFDDRRTSGHTCMGRMGKQNLSPTGIYNVLSTQPNLNKLTAYTAIMNVNTGEMETYLQVCTGQCSPW